MGRQYKSKKQIDRPRASTVGQSNWQFAMTRAKRIPTGAAS